MAEFVRRLTTAIILKYHSFNSIVERRFLHLPHVNHLVHYGIDSEPGYTFDSQFMRDIFAMCEDGVDGKMKFVGNLFVAFALSDCN